MQIFDGIEAKTAVFVELEAARYMEELKARIELLKEQNPIKIQDLERKFGIVEVQLQEAKKILERKEI